MKREEYRDFKELKLKNKSDKYNMPQAGITLVALVVTIVVLLISAGVTVTYVFSNNGILGRAQTATTETDIATTKEQIQYALIETIVTSSEYSVQDVINSAEQVTGSTVNVSEGTVLTSKGNTLDISDLLNGASDIVLGISDNGSGYVIGEISSGEGTGVMYVKVTGQDVENNYDTDSYPTTTATFTEDGETHKYIFAGWYEADDGESYFSSIPTSSSEYAYAKFVDADVLSVQFAVMHGTAENGDEGTTYVRMVSSMDCLNYDETYFRCFIYNGDVLDSNFSTSILSGYYWKDYTITSISKTFYPQDFSTHASYIFTALYSSTEEDLTLQVEAAWITGDGTTVYGTSNSVSI